MRSLGEHGGKGAAAPAVAAVTPSLSLDPFIVEMNRLENLLREKDRALVLAHCEIKALKATESLREKAFADLDKELQKQEERLESLEKHLQQKNLEIKRLNDEKKAAVAAQSAAEAALRRIRSAQRDEQVVPVEAILAPLESDVKKYKNEVFVLQEDKKALERLIKSKEATLMEAGDILRSALERALIVEDVQNQNVDLRRKIEIFQEENKLLEKVNRQKVIEIAKLTQAMRELEESLLDTRTAANTIQHYQNQHMKLNEEKKTLERELAKMKVYVNRVASETANDWKDEHGKLMPVKRWLEERRLLLGEIRRLRDKLAAAERSAKAEAQLMEKMRLKLKAMEDSSKSTKAARAEKFLKQTSSESQPKPELVRVTCGRIPNLKNTREEQARRPQPKIPGVVDQTPKRKMFCS